MPTEKELDAATTAISKTLNWTETDGEMGKIHRQFNCREMADAALKAAEIARAGIRQPEQLGAMDW